VVAEREKLQRLVYLIYGVGGLFFLLLLRLCACVCVVFLALGSSCDRFAGVNRG